MDADAALLERGITPEILRHFGVRLGRRWGLAYYTYPVWDAQGHTVSWRCKRAGAQQNAPKYGWLTERGPARADVLYNALEIAQGKECLVSAGEPDVWLLTTLRLRAYSFLAGEGATPEAAITALLDRKPSHAVVLYDNDEAGHNGAVKVVRRLRDLGLKAGARRLPEEVGPGGDVTDLFRLCGKDRERFVARLAALPYLEIPPPMTCEQRPVEPRRLHVHAPSGGSPIARFKAEHPIAEVVEAAGVHLKPHQGGAYLMGRCPFHRDRTPSLAVYPHCVDAHFHCFGCDAHGDVLDFLELLARHGAASQVSA